MFGMFKTKKKSFDNHMSDDALDDVIEKSGIESGMIYIKEGKRMGAMAVRNLKKIDLLAIKKGIDEIMDENDGDEDTCACGENHEMDEIPKDVLENILSGSVPSPISQRESKLEFIKTVGKKLDKESRGKLIKEVEGLLKDLKSNKK